MAGSRIANLNISFTKRNARRRGPTSSYAWNDSFDEVASDFSSIYDQWNNLLRPLTATIPDGTVDANVDAFTNGLDGQTIYAKSDSTVTDTTYWNTGNTRPNTIYEQLAALYTYIDGINSSLGKEIDGSTFSAANISISDVGTLYDSLNVEDALAEVKELVDDLVDSTLYLPISGGTMTGPIGIGNASDSMSAVVQILKGTSSPEGSVTAPAGSIFVDISGGAGTTLYVKESGAGNTGWAAK